MSKLFSLEIKDIKYFVVKFVVILIYTWSNCLQKCIFKNSDLKICVLKMKF